MERHTRQSAGIPKWSALLVEAVNKPGLIMKAYSNFRSFRWVINCSHSCNVRCEGCSLSRSIPFPSGKSLADTSNAASER